jgi:hypothetical protein
MPPKQTLAYPAARPVRNSKQKGIPKIAYAYPDADVLGKRVYDHASKGQIVVPTDPSDPVRDYLTSELQIAPTEPLAYNESSSGENSEEKRIAVYQEGEDVPRTVALSNMPSKAQRIITQRLQALSHLDKRALAAIRRLASTMKAHPYSLRKDEFRSSEVIPNTTDRTHLRRFIALYPELCTVDPTLGTYVQNSLDQGKGGGLTGKSQTVYTYPDADLVGKPVYYHAAKGEIVVPADLNNPVRDYLTSELQFTPTVPLAYNESSSRENSDEKRIAVYHEREHVPRIVALSKMPNNVQDIITKRLQALSLIDEQVLSSARRLANTLPVHPFSLTMDEFLSSTAITSSTDKTRLGRFRA